MKMKDFKNLLSQYDENEEVYVRYSDKGMVSDIELERVCDDEGIGDFLLLCSNGRNIQETGMDG